MLCEKSSTQKKCRHQVTVVRMAPARPQGGQKLRPWPPIESWWALKSWGKKKRRERTTVTAAKPIFSSTSSTPWSCFAVGWLSSVEQQRCCYNQRRCIVLGQEVPRRQDDILRRKIWSHGISSGKNLFRTGWRHEISEIHMKSNISCQNRPGSNSSSFYKTQFPTTKFQRIFLQTILGRLGLHLVHQPGCKVANQKRANWSADFQTTSSSLHVVSSASSRTLSLLLGQCYSGLQKEQSNCWDVCEDETELSVLLQRLLFNDFLELPTCLGRLKLSDHMVSWFQHQRKEIHKTEMVNPTDLPEHRCSFPKKTSKWLFFIVSMIPKSKVAADFFHLFWILPSWLSLDVCRVHDGSGRPPVTAQKGFLAQQCLWHSRPTGSKDGEAIFVELHVVTVSSNTFKYDQDHDHDNDDHHDHHEIDLRPWWFFVFLFFLLLSLCW